MDDVARLGSVTPLVGRRAEVAALAAALERARGGQPGLVLVSGDAGVGKTRLVDELVAAADGALVLTGRCLEAGESGLPYLPFVEALQGLAGTPGGERLAASPALARLLGRGEAEPPPGDDDLGRLPLFDAVHALLGDVAAEGPVVLVLEDLHWADRSTRDLFSFLTARLRTGRLLVIGTYRAEDLHRRHPLRGLLAELVRRPSVERLHVAPFEPGDADRFVRTAAAGLPDPRLSTVDLHGIAQRSEGNPFLAEELLVACSERSGDDLPPGLADVLLARLELLPDAVQRVVRVAAAGGRRVRHGRLRRVVGLGDAELDEVLRAAVEHHVLVADPSGEGYAFRHALLQEAVYADLLPGERTRLHAGYATVLADETGRGVAAELAHHSLASGAQPVALTASVVAAGESSRAGAPAEALEHLERALQLWSAVPEPERRAGTDEVRLMVDAGIAASAAGDPERALAHLRAAVAAVDDGVDPLGAGYARRILARMLYGVDQCPEALRVTTDALDRLGERPGEWVWVQLLAEHAKALAVDLQLAAAEAAAERAELAARELGLRATLAELLVTRSVVAHRGGRMPAASALLQEAAALAAEEGAVNTRLRATLNLGLLRFEYDRAAEGLATVDDGVRLAEDAGLTWSTYGLELRVMQVLIRAVLGDWDGAECAAEVTTDSVSSLVEARVVAAGVWVAIGRGRFAEAAAQLDRVRPHQHLEQQIAVLIGEGEAELHLWQDRPAEAIAAVQEVLDRLAADGDRAAFVTIRLCALALAGAAKLAATARRGGDPAGLASALATADRLRNLATDVLHSDRPGGRAPGAEAHAWSAVTAAEHARAHGHDDPAHWERAANLFGFGACYEQARCRWRWAGALLAGGDREAAVVPLRQSLETARRLGACPLADAVTRLARRAGVAERVGVDVEPVEPAGSTVDPFTPRERAVLEHVALGGTNREVGAALFISEKTVSVHLSRVMAKLGAASRTEAVSVAHQRGLMPLRGL